MDCFRWAKKDVGTAPFPKAKEYQKLRVGAYHQEGDSHSEIDLYMSDDEESDGESDEESDGESDEESDKEQEDVPDDELQEEFSEQESEKKESVSIERNWWDEYGPETE
jgi:hypothetical protein